MPIIKIDNRDYDLDSLSDEAKAQLVALQFVDAELQRLNAQAAVYQTARVAYAQALNNALPKAPVFNGCTPRWTNAGRHYNVVTDHLIDQKMPIV